jgi:hypothetical protein
MEKYIAAEVEKSAIATQSRIKPPVLFAIPASEYSTEIKKDRNRDLYLKLKQLKKT